MSNASDSNNSVGAVPPPIPVAGPLFSKTGGARIGVVNASWPLAQLIVTPDSLRLSVSFVGDHRFRPDQVIALHCHVILPVLAWGVRVEHVRTDCPAKIVFWCLGHPDRVLQGIKEAGFQATAPAGSVAPPTSWPVRWQIVVPFVLVGNLLVGADMFSQADGFPLPGKLSCVFLGLLSAASLAILRSGTLQRMLLKPGRSIGEIRAYLRLSFAASLLVFAGFLAAQIFR